GSSGVYFSDHPRSTLLGAPNPAASSVHTVQKGETLWGICSQALNNPYQWPRIWSFNPQIQNPHWIYPNEQLRLKPGVPLTAAPQVTTPEEGGGQQAIVGMQERVAPGTIFL